MNNTITILYIILFSLIFVVIALILTYIKIKISEKKQLKKESKTKEISNKKSKEEKKDTIKEVKEYTTDSIFNFMEFDKVEDNMIVQKKDKRFLMVIECQGINYDLMSEVEKASTEQAFSSWLNTLKEPIQIYIQTRTVNLEKNLQNYKKKLSEIDSNLKLGEYKLKQYKERMKNTQDNELVEKQQMEVLRAKNLYSYGRDIIADTEKMSKNKNVLKKKYYIIIKYFHELNEDEVLSKEEIKDMAFSTLYTKAASIIRILSGIGIVGKTLDSFELVDLLYNAYNREDSEIFGIDKAIQAGFNEIYVDTQNVIDKKIEMLNKKIEKEAQNQAQAAIEKARDELEDERRKELEEVEKNLDDIIMSLAKKIIKSNEQNIGHDLSQRAIEQVNKGNKEGDKRDVKKEQAKTIARRTRK